MRIYFRLSLLTLLLTGVFVFASYPAAVRAASSFCNAINGDSYGPSTSGSAFVGTPFDIGDTVTITHTGTASQATIQAPFGTTVAVIPKGGSATITITTAGITVLYILNSTGVVTDYVQGSVSCGDAPPASTGEVLFNPGDGRINHHVADRAAPAAVYCDDGLLVIRIDPVTAKGTDEIRLTAAEIEAAGVPSEGNIILAETDWAIVARLSDGRFSLNTWYKDGKPYTIIWGECSLASIEYIAR
jgi:hypothetical protein